MVHVHDDECPKVFWFFFFLLLLMLLLFIIHHLPMNAVFSYKCNWITFSVISAAQHSILVELIVFFSQLCNFLSIQSEWGDGKYIIKTNEIRKKQEIMMTHLPLIFNEFSFFLFLFHLYNYLFIMVCICVCAKTVSDDSTKNDVFAYCSMCYFFFMRVILLLSS